MSIRAAFVEQFGESDAQAIESAAESHKNGLHDEPGSDPFKWALAICIGYECITRFRTSHGITADEGELREWVIEHADLGSHDGDVDSVSLFTGVYDAWVKRSVTS